MAAAGVESCLERMSSRGREPVPGLDVGEVLGVAGSRAWMVVARLEACSLTGIVAVTVAAAVRLVSEMQTTRRSRTSASSR